MIRKILSAKTHSGRLMGFLIIIKAPIFCKRIWIQWKILQSVPVCQLSVKKRGLSYLISRRDPEKEEIFRVLKPPSNHKHFLLQGGDSKIKPIFLHHCCREREKYLWGMKIYECFIYYNITLCLVARCWVLWKAIIDGRRRLFVSEAIISHTSALLHSLRFFISIFLCSQLFGRELRCPDIFL